MPIVHLLPLLRVCDALSAIAFYQRVFDAVEEYRIVDAEGRIAQAELTIGTARLLLSDAAFADVADVGDAAATDDAVAGSPRPAIGNDAGSRSATLHLSADADAGDGAVSPIGDWAERLRRAGATPLAAPPAIPGRQRSLWRDPFGHCWLIERPVEAGPDDELALRMAQMRAQDA